MGTEHGLGDLFHSFLDQQLGQASLDRNQNGLLDSAHFYRSYGRQYAQDWAMKDTGTAGLGGILRYMSFSGRSSGRPRSTPKDSISLSNRRDRKIVTNFAVKRKELSPAGVENAGGTASTQHQDYIIVSEEEVSIRVDLQSILCDLKLSNELQDYRLVATSLEPLAEKLGTIVLITGGDTRELGYDNPSTFQGMHAFGIHDDGAILAETGSRRGIVIGTPTLRNRQWTSVIPEMAKVFQSSSNMAFNASTGLHIHIGIGRDYTLEDLKRISKAIVLFEKQMDTYHPKSRNPNSPTEWPYVYSHILPCCGSGPLAGHNTADMMRTIDGAQSIQGLLSIINHDNLVYSGRSHRRYRYNLTNVLYTKTIEFRQALGTVEPHRVLEWIKRVIKFVTSAIATPGYEFAGWAKSRIWDSGIYYRFGVPPPPVRGLGLRIRIFAPKKQVRFVKAKDIAWRDRKRDIWLFEQVRAGKVGREFSWFVYCWRKVSGGSNEFILSRMTCFLSTTVILILTPGQEV